MLVLSRRKNEAVWIGDARVVVLERRGGQIRLGIAAPAHVRVLREELRPDPPAREPEKAL